MQDIVVLTPDSQALERAADASPGGFDPAAKPISATHWCGPSPRRQGRTPSLNDPRFRRMVERVVALGPRTVAELLIELGADLHRVERYADLDRFSPGILHIIGADHWPTTLFVVGAT